MVYIEKQHAAEDLAVAEHPDDFSGKRRRGGKKHGHTKTISEPKKHSRVLPWFFVGVVVAVFTFLGVVAVVWMQVQQMIQQ